MIKPINRTVKAINFGCYLKKPQTSMNIRIEFFRKSSSNVFHPGSIRFVQDYCAMMRGEDSVITRTFPRVSQMFSDLLKPCPVIGKHMFQNMPFDSALLPSTLLPTGDYRMDCRTYNDLNETISIAKFFVAVKNPFF
jgi:Protein of unknown function (DUF1091)